MLPQLNSSVRFGSDAGKQLNMETDRLLSTYANKDESDRVINSFVQVADTFIATAKKEDAEDIDAAGRFTTALQVCERVESGMSMRWGVLLALKEKIRRFLAG